MDPAKMENLDRILRAEGELAPSSGFVSAVMERVREEAVAPKPIPFPWRRVAPGAVVAVGGVVWIGGSGGAEGESHAASESPVLLWTHVPKQMTGALESAGWLAAALGVSLLSWLLARRMAGRR